MKYDQWRAQEFYVGERGGKKTGTTKFRCILIWHLIGYQINTI